MKVIRAAVMGFCMGVRRAVDISLKSSTRKEGDDVPPVPVPADSRDYRIYTLGPLIHNPIVLDNLKNRGITVLDEDEVPEYPGNSAVIIRAHGVPPSVEEALARKGVLVLDATCPHVKANQNKARQLSGNGYYIFLAGEKEHAEIIGIRGYIDGPCSIVAGPDGAEEAASLLAQSNPQAKTALLGQTTISPEEYHAIEVSIKRYFPNLETVNTICGATRERQNALRELSAQVDAVVIAGSRESANSRRLLSIAESLGVKAWLVEAPGELPPEIKQYKTAGLCAGASTPDSLIDEIEEILCNL